MKALLPTVLMLALATGFKPAEVWARGQIGEQAAGFLLENAQDSPPDSISLVEHRGSVVVLAFFTLY